MVQWERGKQTQTYRQEILWVSEGDRPRRIGWKVYELVCVCVCEREREIEKFKRDR